MEFCSLFVLLSNTIKMCVLRDSDLKFLQEKFVGHTCKIIRSDPNICYPKKNHHGEYDVLEADLDGCKKVTSKFPGN